MANNSTAEFREELEDMGLVVTQGKHNHYKVHTKTGIWVMDYAHSPGDQHWRKQATRRLQAKLRMIYGG